MELPDHEIEQTFKVNILSHYWVSKIKHYELIKVFLLLDFSFGKIVKILRSKRVTFCVLLPTFTDYKILLARHEEKQSRSHRDDSEHRRAYGDLQLHGLFCDEIRRHRIPRKSLYRT
jgi:hypothetical protein